MPCKTQVFKSGFGKTGLAIRLSEADLPPLFAHVLPLTGSDFRTRLQPAAVAAVFIGTPPDEQDGADAVATVYGLTQAETRVLPACSPGARWPRPLNARHFPDDGENAP